MSEYLKFQEVPKPKRKTKFVRVMSKDGETLLGEISFCQRGGTFVGGMPAWYLSGLMEGYAWTGEEEVLGNIYANPELLKESGASE